MRHEPGRVSRTNCGFWLGCVAWRHVVTLLCVAWCVWIAQGLQDAVQAVEDAGYAEAEAIALARKLARQRRRRTTHVSVEAVSRAKEKEAAATAAYSVAKAELQDMLDTMNAHRCTAFPEVQFFMCVQSCRYTVVYWFQL